MRIAILSDTHLPRFGRVLPPWLVASLEAASVERILHAGDWTAELAVDLLEAIAPVDGVAGNNDGPELHERFGTRRVIEIDGVRIGITHGHLGPGRTTEERARNAFDAEPRSTRSSSATATCHWSAASPAAPGSSTRARRRTSAASRTPPGPLATIEDGAITTVELVRGPAGPPNALSSRA